MVTWSGIRHLGRKIICKCSCENITAGIKNSADGFNSMSKLDVGEEQVIGVEDDVDDTTHDRNSFSISVVGLGRAEKKIEALEEIIP